MSENTNHFQSKIISTYNGEKKVDRPSPKERAEIFLEISKHLCPGIHSEMMDSLIDGTYDRIKESSLKVMNALAIEKDTHTHMQFMRAIHSLVDDVNISKASQKKKRKAFSSYITEPFFLLVIKVAIVTLWFVYLIKVLLF